MGDHDFILAQQLQDEFDKESAAILVSKDETIDSTSGHSSTHSKNDSSSTHSQALSVIDPSFEISDPNPDVRALFIQFNDQYFWGRLSSVEVRWSPRMTLCAGICHYEGRGGLCSVRLSLPLLKLRPRKDLVETLLHEMIHAFLFVTDNDRDHDGHGPNFKKHMHRINQASGSHISIYHTFHDEVDSYRQHWWRCDGPCRNRSPYLGFVKRAMNRAPSARDPWWANHAHSCGGSYTKVKEPEGYGVKKKDSKEQKKDKEEHKAMNKDIRSFLQVPGKGTKNKGSTSGTNKKTTSTATSSGSPSASGVPSSTHSAHAGNGADNTGHDFSLVWGGGMWTPEKDTSKRPKNWTAVQTKNDKEVKLKSSSSGSATLQKSDGSGNVLGGGSGTGESWLAKMRKQWGKEMESAKPASPHHTDPAGGSGKGNTVRSAASESKPEPLKREPDDLGGNPSLTSSDDSHHSSFHVSSCEEDNWPTPEKCKIRHEHTKGHSGNELNRKRKVIELISSDEDDFHSQAVSQPAKPATKASRFEHDSQSDSDSDIFQWMKAKTQSKNNGKRNIQSWKGKGTRVKHQGGENVPNGHRFTSETDSSTSCSEANASSHSSGGHSSGAPSGISEASVSLVACPVCQRKMPADNINGHLDTCLS